MLNILSGSVRLLEKPEFSWILEGDEDQVCFEIRIKDAYGRLYWDSGEIVSGKRHNIVCDKALKDESIYTWSVRVQGAIGGTAEYQGGKIYTKISSWSAKWIEPDRVRKPLTDSMEPIEPVAKGKVPGDSLEKLDPVTCFRKEFELPEVPAQALVYAASHGIYTLYMNGRRVSDLFAPGYTSYEKHIDYQCYEVTDLLRTGKNVMAFELADGWYTGKISALGIGQQFGTENAILGELILKNPDGSRTAIITDEGMRWSEGALRYADLYIGEYYDSHYLKEGWEQPAFEMDHSWRAAVARDYGYETLVMQTIPGIKEIRTIRPEILFAPNGDMLLDAGENIVGYVSFELDLKAGDIVSMEHSETLDKDGNYIQNIIGQNKDQMDFYAASADGVAIYKPEFTFHGFRYVRVNGTKDADKEHYLIHVIGTPLRKTGEFTCSDDRLNKLQEVICRSQLGNMISIPTDCPQRERTGWLGDMQVFAPTGCYEYDIEEFLRHWLADIRNEQLPDGQIPHITPCMKSHDIMKPPGIKGVSAAGWSDAAVIIPWRLYEAYGDINILKENFEMIKSYMASTEELAAELPADYEELDDARKAVQKYLWNTGFQYGDWLMPSIQMSGKPIFEVVAQTGYVVATLMFMLTTDITAKICDLLGESRLCRHYQELNEKVREAFAVEYINADGTLSKDYQGIYVLALKANAIPEELKPRAVQRLAELIHENHDLLDTGFLSVAYLLPVLKENGLKKLANRLLFQDECPSWLYEIKMGATTMWEYWNGYAPDGTPSDCSMNHFAFGCVGEYLFHDILGIQNTDPGRGILEIEPDIDCGLTWVKGSYETVWGNCRVEWKKESKHTALYLELPPNVTAKVRIGEHIRTFGCGTHRMEV
ncbi:hypothetical protein D3Z53_00450 [Lachnospiraceae bacterium]|nr:family 78 glycoside hydrolase catalytic domain [uncultured Schaedlerella sp.]MCI9152639.1 family 78 glycoside hydrolase catalytic domain [Ruminococcus sp.]NBI56564.1 hypothetical protein [Lachnospiraceae bacterium]